VDYQFRINLRGIIDLLSNHLYSGPEVFLRELLQNCVDALHARALLSRQDKSGSTPDEITIEVSAPRGDRPPTLAFLDNGIGLTEEELHRFLATIGQTSKSGDFWERPDDFIGRFGIGLLSCFVVSDEIVAITRSARAPDAPTIEWRGRPDGTYSIKVLQRSIEPGTQVYLTCKPGCEEHFEAERVIESARHFGGLLPHPIRVIAGKRNEVINADGVPWRRQFASEDERREALLDYGRRTFNTDFIDCIPLKSDVGKVDGIAFVLPFSPSLATKRTHRVYLKHMLLSETAENLVPEWAFFVKCVVNANDLRPTASRESFYEDDQLVATRDALGDCLRDYLVRMAKRSPERLRRLIALHHLSIKALAVRDDDFYRLFIDWLPFETSMGEMSFGEFRQKADVVRFVPHLDQFRQIAPVAGAQGIYILNAAYTYDEELLRKFNDVFPDVEVEEVDPTSLTQSLDELSLEEREQVFHLLKAADIVLQPFRCVADVKKFRPKELPALFTTTPDADFRRSAEQSKEVTSGLWSDVLGNLVDAGLAEGYAKLCFNFHNPLVQRLSAVKDKKVLRRSIEMLYVQALLMGHRPLSAQEMKLLNEGLLGMIEWGLERSQ
jgi:molecular chaperone HtpG